MNVVLAFVSVEFTAITVIPAINLLIFIEDIVRFYAVLLLPPDCCSLRRAFLYSGDPVEPLHKLIFLVNGIDVQSVQVSKL
jgi:hypothetical protein